ncbi:hypothetical protein EDB85DRAFT_175300 [Lactarius pseudohatsudake]|nr:hypothetical protein EDB85DRAFT_175300 [Lactarius pseudohatsudake]
MLYRCQYVLPLPCLPRLQRNACVEIRSMRTEAVVTQLPVSAHTGFDNVSPPRLPWQRSALAKTSKMRDRSKEHQPLFLVHQPTRSLHHHQRYCGHCLRSITPPELHLIVDSVEWGPSSSPQCTAHCLYAWPGILVLKDNQASVDFPAVHAVEIECATHAYEGRFSTETNALPVFSTFFRGAHLSKKELAESEKVFDPSLGIIMQEDWSDAQVRKNQWYVKFWVPIPISLFRKKDTRMFRLRASVCVVDERMWKKVTLHSGTVVADISHLRKHKDMDGAAARA